MTAAYGYDFAFAKSLGDKRAEGVLHVRAEIRRARGVLSRRFLLHVKTVDDGIIRRVSRVVLSRRHDLRFNWVSYTDDDDVTFFSRHSVNDVTLLASLRRRLWFALFSRDVVTIV